MRYAVKAVIKYVLMVSLLYIILQMVLSRGSFFVERCGSELEVILNSSLGWLPWTILIIAIGILFIVSRKFGMEDKLIVFDILLFVLFAVFVAQQTTFMDTRVYFDFTVVSGSVRCENNMLSFILKNPNNKRFEGNEISNILDINEHKIGMQNICIDGRGTKEISINCEEYCDREMNILALGTAGAVYQIPFQC